VTVDSEDYLQEQETNGVSRRCGGKGRDEEAARQREDEEVRRESNYHTDQLIAEAAVFKAVSSPFPLPT
jgi:hypothetical protein